MSRGRSIAFVLLFLSGAATASGQQAEGAPDSTSGTGLDAASAVEQLRPAPADFWTSLRRIILPRQVSLVYDLRSFIAAQRPLNPRSREGDLRRLDAIYLHAVYLAEGDPYLALFALSFATLPYHTFPARIPLFNFGITVPVSTESHAAFEQRMENLPGLLLRDSPRSLDRDKLPHFFGSAWLQCVTRNPALVETAGELLETGEEIFKLEGSRDPRDIMVNRLGADFAMALQRHEDVLPSEIFKQSDESIHGHTTHSHR